MSGRITIKMIQPAFTPPEMSSRRKMSANTAMNIQMNMNQKKKTIIAQRTSPKLHSASTRPPFSVTVRRIAESRRRRSTVP